MVSIRPAGKILKYEFPMNLNFSLDILSLATRSVNIEIENQ